MGQVYRGVHEAIEKTVALRSLRPELSRKPVRRSSTSGAVDCPGLRHGCAAPRTVCTGRTTALPARVGFNRTIQ